VFLTEGSSIDNEIHWRERVCTEFKGGRIVFLFSFFFMVWERNKEGVFIKKEEMEFSFL
jgi:hypothetical protein